MGVTRGRTRKGCWPAAVVFDDLVDLGHEADGLGEGDDDFVVMGDVFVGEGAAFAVFEPFFADLVAADVEVPDILWDSLEAAGACGGGGFLAAGVDPNRIIHPADFEDFAGMADELGCWDVELGRFQQVQGGEFAAEPGQRAEQLKVPGQRQAREIDLQKLRIAAPVAGTVKHRVGVVEDVFGRQAGGQAVSALLR